MNSGGNQASPAGNLPALESTGTSLDYASGAPNATMSSQMIGSTGGSQSVPIVQPSLAVSFIIALQGIFPPRS